MTRAPRAVRRARWVAAALALLAGAAGAEPARATTPCRVDGLSHEVQCGVLQRPLDPARPQGVQIGLHYLVVPALARNKLPDPVFLLAGGPGQSAVKLAPALMPLFARLNNRRDLVFVDQRGTGRSAPLVCDEPRTRPLAELADAKAMAARLAACRATLQALPHGDLRFYTTPLAVQDLDAVRRALGAAQVNLVGASYGTRVGLEWLRQFPSTVRRAVLDGVAPADMVLPASLSTDADAALDAVFAACEREPACAAAHPALRADWSALLARLPQAASVRHPVTGRREELAVTRDLVLGAVRGPLYVPAFAAALPAAIAEAAAGRFEALFGLGSAADGTDAGSLAMGMHFSVICAEDVPRLASAGDRPGAVFGDAGAALYREVCADWPRGALPADFAAIAPAASPVLLLSGGVDPATPPRHGERVARRLGPKALHVVVPEAGHGVMAIGCMRDVLFRFVDAADEREALAVDAGCAKTLPRPPAFRLPGAAP